MNTTTSAAPAPTFTHDAIVNTVIVRISEESGQPATLQSNLMDDLDLDSLDFVNVAQIMEAEFGIGPIPDSDIFKLTTVEQVVLYIEAWLDKQANVLAAQVKQ